MPYALFHWMLAVTKSRVERNQLRLFLSWPALMTRGAIWRQSLFGTMRDRVGKQPSPVLWLIRPTYFLKGHKTWDAVSITTSSEGKDLFCEFEHILLYSLAFLLLLSDVITHKNMAKGSSGTGIFIVTRQENVRQIPALQPAAISFSSFTFSALTCFMLVFMYTE